MVTSEGFQDLGGTPSAPVTIQSLHQGHGGTLKWTRMGGSSSGCRQSARHATLRPHSLLWAPLDQAKLAPHTATESQEIHPVMHFFFFFEKSFYIYKNDILCCAIQTLRKELLLEHMDQPISKSYVGCKKQSLSWMLRWEDTHSLLRFDYH